MLTDVVSVKYFYEYLITTVWHIFIWWMRNWHKFTVKWLFTLRNQHSTRCLWV